MNMVFDVEGMFRYFEAKRIAEKQSQENNKGEGK